MSKQVENEGRLRKKHEATEFDLVLSWESKYLHEPFQQIESPFPFTTDHMSGRGRDTGNKQRFINRQFIIFQPGRESELAKLPDEVLHHGGVVAVAGGADDVRQRHLGLHGHDSCRR